MLNLYYSFLYYSFFLNNRKVLLSWMEDVTDDPVYFLCYVVLDFIHLVLYNDYVR